MSFDEDPPLRQQLLDARTNIIAQLEDLNFRSNAVGFARRGDPPDYRSVIAQLEGQLNEINGILDDNEQPDA